MSNRLRKEDILYIPQSVFPLHDHMSNIFKMVISDYLFLILFVKVLLKYDKIFIFSIEPYLICLDAQFGFGLFVTGLVGITYRKHIVE